MPSKNQEIHYISPKNTGQICEGLPSTDEKAKKEFMNHISYVFSAPILVAPGYEDIITPEIRNNAITHRLAHTKDIESGLCTDYELAVHFMTVSLITKLDSLGSKFYQYVFNKAYGKPQDIELDEYELQELNQVKSKIFKRQMAVLKI